MPPRAPVAGDRGRSQNKSKKPQNEDTNAAEDLKTKGYVPSNTDYRCHPVLPPPLQVPDAQTPRKTPRARLNEKTRDSSSPYLPTQSRKPPRYTDSSASSGASEQFVDLENPVISSWMIPKQSSRSHAELEEAVGRRRRRREPEVPKVRYPNLKIPVIDLDSESEVDYFSADDSPPRNDGLKCSVLKPPKIRPTSMKTPQNPLLSTPRPESSRGKLDGTRHEPPDNSNAYKETWGVPLRSRQREKQPIPIRYSSFTVPDDENTSKESSFDDTFQFDQKSFRSTPATTTKNSFASQYGGKHNFGAYREYEEEPTDIDEDPREPVLRKGKTSLTIQNTARLGAGTSESPTTIHMGENYRRDSMEVIQQADACYQPDSDEEELLALQRDFEEPALDTMTTAPGPDDAAGILFSSDDEFGIDDEMAEELSMLILEDNNEPTPVLTTQPFDRFPYFVQFEMTRLALDMGFSVEDCRNILPNIAQEYGVALLDAPTRDAFVEAFDRLKKVFFERTGKQPSECSNIGDGVWVAIKSSKNWPENLQLSGRLEYSDRDGFDMNLRLNPLSLSQGNRFSYRFGRDRFLTLNLPGRLTSESNLPPGLSKLQADELQERLRTWLRTTRLEILNRTWRCFFVRDASEKDTVKGIKKTSSVIRAFFFAEAGVGLGRCTVIRKRDLRLDDTVMEKDYSLRRDEMSREELIMWHMPVDKIMAGIEAESDYQERGGKFAKAWSRIALSLSTSRPTVTFRPDQIKLVNDTKSNPSNPLVEPAVMNDGCCVCSPEVMRQVRDKLSLDETPSAVQGRLGGAKGMWFIDPDADWSSKDIWIQVRPSQLKYPLHDSDLQIGESDWARLTLFVLKTPKDPTASHLNSQLVPILSERKVPASVFEELLNEDLELELGELLKAAIGRIDLRRWLNGPGGMSREREGNWEIRGYEGGLPRSQMEIIAFLIDAGFEPTECHYLVTLLASVVETRCNSVTDRTHISVPQSTMVFCLADPTGTLEAGTISLNLAGFMDAREQAKITMLEGEVLVARNPAHLPSDIQKVRAVCPTHPGLRRLQNVAIFSTKGDYPLAGLLSGGDYDGDQVWVTWDSRLVETFQNSKNNYLRFTIEKRFFKPSLPPSDLNPDPSDPQFFDQFFEQGFSASLIENLTGRCTSILERYIYAQGRNIRIDSDAVTCGKLCGVFVDAVKQGLVPKPETLEFLEKLNRMSRLPPLYKSPQGTRPLGDKDDWFILDYLVFHVAKKKADEKKKEFDRMRVTSNMDPDLLAYRRNVLAFAEDQARNGNPRPLRVVKKLEAKLQELVKDWGSKMYGAEGKFFHANLENIYNEYQALRPPAEELVDPCVAFWDTQANEAGSSWRKLRASVLFSLCANGTSKLPWWMAAWELAFLKAVERRKQFNVQAPRVVAVDIYSVLRPSKQVRKMPEPSLYLSDAGTRRLS